MYVLGEPLKLCFVILPGYTVKGVLCPFFLFNDILLASSVKAVMLAAVSCRLSLLFPE
jgi:hypothetical protein